MIRYRDEVRTVLSSFAALHHQNAVTTPSYVIRKFVVTLSVVTLSACLLLHYRLLPIIGKFRSYIIGAYFVTLSVSCYTVGKFGVTLSVDVTLWGVVTLPGVTRSFHLPGLPFIFTR